MTPKDKAADKLRKKLLKLHRLLGSANVNEREIARIKLDELLAKHKKTWNDFTDVVAGGDTQDWRGVPDDGAAPDDDDEGPATPTPLELVYHIFERHLHLTEDQLVAVTLWTAHTHVYDRFSITPRLILTSPAPGCGKTTALDIIRALGLRTHRIDNLTQAVLYRRLDRDRAAVLIDEADNQDLPRDHKLCAVVASGHRYGGVIERVLGGEVARFEVFAPLALATIHTRLPLAILHRSVVLHMERSPTPLMRFDPRGAATQQADLHTVYSHLHAWAKNVQLDLDPAMPAKLHNRVADNWRVLISIADSINDGWGIAARKAALKLSEWQGEDLAIILLSDIRDIFNRRGYDRIASATLIAELTDLPDAPWSEFRGLRGDQAARRLTASQLAQVLGPFGIKPKTLWPQARQAGARSAKGYLRADFERAWRSYCGGGTPAHTSALRHLH